MLGDFLDFGNQARALRLQAEGALLFIAYEPSWRLLRRGYRAGLPHVSRRDELAAQEDQILDGLPPRRGKTTGSRQSATIDERTSSHQDQLTEPVHDGGAIA